ncbi:MAG: DUF58 domain-containing protein [Planctomycetes bacterium]|nr:DUF58 domain-containing protein [Planctomycetota bacterium]
MICIPAVLSAGLVIDQSWLPALVILDAGILLAALIDAWLGAVGVREVTIDQECAGTWSIGRPEAMSFTVMNHGRLPRRISAAADLPRELRVDHATIDARIPGRSRATLTFRVTAQERGSFALAGLHIAITSHLGLWRSRRRLGPERTIHVYPNLKQLGEYTLLARTNRLNLIGVRTSRRGGGDTEFERLRDWHSDDSLQHVDWKATARRDVLTVRDYQANQSQGLMLMIDAGRMMVSRSRSADGSSASLLDHAIDSALMLAFIALSQGDRVGLVAYADGVLRHVPSHGGQRQLTTLIHALHDLHPRLVESRHEDAFLHLRRRERKRSLVAVFTHVLDEVNAEHIERHCTDLVGRHLPLVVMLRDHDLHDHLAQPPRDPAAFWRAGAAAHIVNWRAEVLGRLARAGALAIDTDPERLTPALVNQYLRVKARHLL